MIDEEVAWGDEDTPEENEAQGGTADRPWFLPDGKELPKPLPKKQIGETAKQNVPHRIAFKIRRSPSGKIVYTSNKDLLKDLGVWEIFVPRKNSYQLEGKSQMDAWLMALRDLGGYDEEKEVKPGEPEKEAPADPGSIFAHAAGVKFKKNEWNLLEDMKWVFQNLYSDKPKKLGCPSYFAWGFLIDLKRLDDAKRVAIMEKFIDRLLPNRVQMDKEHGFQDADRNLEDTLARVAQTAKDARLTTVLSGGAPGNGS